MKTKTIELIGDALNWAVTYALHGEAVHYIFEHQPRCAHRYSTNWYIGGQIIERERIDLFWQSESQCFVGSMTRLHKVGWGHLQYGPTPLIAAMRCYVTSKLGDEVEIPEELL